jgi:hypothetical protein
MVETSSVIRALSSSKIAGRGGTKTLSLVNPFIENSRGVKLGNFCGRDIVPPRPIQAIRRVTRGDHTEQLRIFVDKTEIYVL